MFRPTVLRRVLRGSRRASLIDSIEPPQSDEFEDLAAQKCLDAASQSIALITDFWFSHPKNMLTCWYALYFLFQATLIPVICLRNEPRSALAPAWREQVSLALKSIEDMGGLNPAAYRCQEVLTKLCGQFLSTDGNWNSPIQESPQTQLTGLYPFMWPMMDTSQNDGPDIFM